MAVLGRDGAREDFADEVDDSIGTSAELADDLEVWSNAGGIVVD